MESALIREGAEGAPANFALEEALLQTNRSLILRLWGNERSVIIGRAQLAHYETDVDRCMRERIPIVRRVTAGGAIYNGPGNINWSLLVGRDFEAGTIRYLWGVREVFRMAAGLVVRATADCGVRTWLDEPNRIVSAEGKVCGMAAYISRGGLLCHGTLLLNADLAEAGALTHPATAKLASKYTRSVEMKMANTGITVDAFIVSMGNAVEEMTGMKITAREPSEAERNSMERLLPKYNDPTWNLGDPFTEGPV